MDWFSRYVIAWELSTTLDSDFCVRCLEWALEAGKPEIFNTDQGVQYTSEDFTKTLLAADVRISMNGAGRCFDNIMVERLWRSVKQEEVYLKEYEDVARLPRESRRVFRVLQRPAASQPVGRPAGGDLLRGELNE